MNKLDIKEIKKGAVRVFEKKQDMLDFVKKYAFDNPERLVIHRIKTKWIVYQHENDNEENSNVNTIKALEYFIDMKEANQLDYGDEYIKCLAIENELIFADFMKRNLSRWLELLETDGSNSKNMVATDIQKLLEEIKNEKKFNI